MQIKNMLVIERKRHIEELSSRRVPDDERRYKITEPGACVYALGQRIPCVIENSLVGFATPYEVHMTATETTIFFNIHYMQLSQKTARFIGELMDSDDASKTRGQSYGETSNTSHTSTMDPAMAMSMGLDDMAGDIAEDNGGDRRGGISIWDL